MASKPQTGIALTAAGSILSGGPVEGTATFGLTTTGDMGLVVSLSGTATLTLSLANADLKLTIGMDGSFTMVLSGDASLLSLIVPLEGTTTLGIAGSADLKGLLSLAGDWSSEAIALSPENVAQAVWAKLLRDGYTAEQLFAIVASKCAGKTEINDLGGGNAQVIFRSINDDRDVIDADMTGSERTSVTLNP
jgi:hypothetical protein